MRNKYFETVRGYSLADLLAAPIDPVGFKVMIHLLLLDDGQPVDFKVLAHLLTEPADAIAAAAKGLAQDDLVVWRDGTVGLISGSPWWNSKFARVLRAGEVSAKLQETLDENEALKARVAAVEAERDALAAKIEGSSEPDPLFSTVKNEDPALEKTEKPKEKKQRARVRRSKKAGGGDAAA